MVCRDGRVYEGRLEDVKFGNPRKLITAIKRLPRYRKKRFVSGCFLIHNRLLHTRVIFDRYIVRVKFIFLVKVVM